MHLFLLIVAAYFLGSIPTALWISKLFFGIDIREHGSKNMGASNAFRILGPWYGLFVLLVDMGKAVVAVLLANQVSATDFLGNELMLWQLIFGLTAVAGHIFPVFAGFRGGKGVASLFGVVLAIQPWTAIICISAFLAVVLVTRYISLGSLTAVVVFAVCIFFAVKEENNYMRWFSIVAATLVIILHRKNISRLLKGTETKISFRKKRNKED